MEHFGQWSLGDNKVGPDTGLGAAERLPSVNTTFLGFSPGHPALSLGRLTLEGVLAGVPAGSQG
jgi:hypothetical protein